MENIKPHKPLHSVVNAKASLLSYSLGYVSGCYCQVPEGARVITKRMITIILTYLYLVLNIA